MGDPEQMRGHLLVTSSLNSANTADFEIANGGLTVSNSGRLSTAVGRSETEASSVIAIRREFDPKPSLVRVCFAASQRAETIP